MSIVKAFAELLIGDKVKLAGTARPGVVTSTPTDGLLPHTMTVTLRLPWGYTTFLDGTPGQPILMWEVEPPQAEVAAASNKSYASRGGFAWHNKLRAARKLATAGALVLGVLLGAGQASARTEAEIMAGLPPNASYPFIPHYDLEASCRNLANTTNAAGRGHEWWVAAYNECLEPEQDAYNFLKLTWTQTDRATQNQCLRNQPMYNGRIVFIYGLYQRLARCVYLHRNQGAVHHFQP